MIKPTMSWVMDKNHLNEMLVKYYEDREKLINDAPFYQWFDDLGDGDQKVITNMLDKCGLGLPREYDSAADILIDIDRVTYLF